MTSPLQRVLITGASGLLGSPLTRRFKHLGSWYVVAKNHAQLDITDLDAVRKVMRREAPNVVVNCAAFTKVDACEAQHELANRVNGEGAGIIAEAAAEIDARFVHISTDYVFDGNSNRPYREDDPPAPPERLNAYGRSKLLGEQQVTAHHPSPLIVRTSWVFGEDGPCFPKTILRLAKERPELRVVNDQLGSPTYAADLADALFALNNGPGVTGLFHITNSGACTWFEFAQEILRAAGLTTPIIPVTTQQFPLPAKRPAYSVLDNTRFNEIMGRSMRNWRDATNAFITNTQSQ